MVKIIALNPCAEFMTFYLELLEGENISFQIKLIECAERWVLRMKDVVFLKDTQYRLKAIAFNLSSDAWAAFLACVKLIRIYGGDELLWRTAAIQIKKADA